MVCLWVLVHSGSLIHVTVNAVHTVIFILLYFELVLPSCISSLLLKSFHCLSREGLHLGSGECRNISIFMRVIFFQLHWSIWKYTIWKYALYGIVLIGKPLWNSPPSFTYWFIQGVEFRVQIKGEHYQLSDVSLNCSFKFCLRTWKLHLSLINVRFSWHFTKHTRPLSFFAPKKKWKDQFFIHPNYWVNLTVLHAMPGVSIQIIKLQLRLGAFSKWWHSYWRNTLS